MAAHNELGKWGEKIAREYLLTQGWAIGGENTKIGNYEIDFIAMKDDTIAFVEVKTRTTDLVDPLEAINHKKQTRLCRAADSYMRAYGIPLEPRFDVITIIGTQDNYRLEYIPDAFLPPLNGF